MIRRPPRSTQSRSSAASDVYKRQVIYNALLHPMEVSKFTRTLAKISKEIGSEFSLYEGKIVGTIEELVENQKIVQKWKMNDWPNYSQVVINLIEREEDECIVEVIQTQLPNSIDVSKLEAGWRDQIFRPLSSICGYPMDQD
eukprot:TRINITY_DN2541_c0_g1_i9.p2 TRINITY_DN2541_c0_g1~~TRINITY_DN2541_c0_g1_i9.p2  ORF type:complete len:142 (+),score=54.64 TRINITY_DN2541_c0_g1_i9:28-453(+)